MGAVEFRGCSIHSALLERRCLVAVGKVHFDVVREVASSIVGSLRVVVL